MNQQVALREQKMMDALELQAVKNQLSSLLDNNPRKMEAFKTNVIKMSLQGMLKSCSPESIIQSGIHALSLNLPIQNGQGYIVKYGNDASFDVGYKGWQVLAKRAGLLAEADVVYNCDEFDQTGFGFNREMHFKPNYGERNSSDDKWARENLSGVIVSILDTETKSQTYSFVDADKIKKIAGKSPSLDTEKGRKYSPHMLWSEEMFRAKAVKYVVSKWPVDLSEASQLGEAIQVVNQTESLAQAQAQAAQKTYDDETFAELFGKWAELVKSGQKQAMSIITQISNSVKLTSEQLEKLFTLQGLEPIEGEAE